MELLDDRQAKFQTPSKFYLLFFQFPDSSIALSLSLISSPSIKQQRQHLKTVRLLNRTN